MLLLLALALSQNQPDSVKCEPAIGEKHFRNIRQITFGGENAEAYLNPRCNKLVWQAKVPGYPDDQIFEMNLDGSGKRLISTGLGRCTCSYFTPDGKWIFFSSTHATQPGPQAPLDFSKGYVWMVNPNFAMYRRPADGAATDPHALAADPHGPNNGEIGGIKFEPVVKKDGAYVAETTIAPNGKYMAWTSDFEGDLDIYRSDLDGGNIQRLTNEVGYDGGPFVSWDSKKIVYRRDEFKGLSDIDDYKALLKDHLIRPTVLEIWMMDADGGNKHQITHMGCASFAPFLAPDNKHIIFSSNYGDPQGREFELFMINVDGTGLEKITTTPGFDGFPMFTKNGKKIIWCSNRNGKEPHETDVFVADWKA
jgi:Tol biopolymer transport system component